MFNGLNDPLCCGNDKVKVFMGSNSINYYKGPSIMMVQYNFYELWSLIMCKILKNFRTT